MHTRAAEKAAPSTVRLWTCVALLVAAVAVVFLDARHGALLAWDDDINITTNPHLRGLTWENLKWMFTDAGYMRRYVPLAWLGWGLEHALFGLTAVSCHLGNIGLHAANAVLVFLLLNRVLRFLHEGDAVSDRAMQWSAAAGALLWALHPLRVELVAWASGRIHGQASFFLLLATVAYLKAHEPRADNATRRRWVAAALAACTASLLTYPLGVTYVAVLLVIDVCLLRRWRAGAGFWRDAGNRAVWLEKLPFVAVTLVVLGITVVARFQAGAQWPAAPTLEQFGLWARAAQAFYLWAYYAWKPFVPFDLAPVYTTLVAFKPQEPRFVLSAVGVIAVTASLVSQRRRWPGALGLWVCHLAILVPLLGLTEYPHYPNDRYGHVQGVLGALALAALLVHMRSRSAGPAAAAAVASVAVGLGVLSWKQVGIWRDNETLFRGLLARIGNHPYRADIALRLGDVVRAQGHAAEAEQFYRQSLALRPGGARAGYVHWALAKLAEARRDPEQAIAHHRQAIALDPRLAEAWFDLGALLTGLGRSAEAIEILQRALALEPARPAGHVALGLALADQGRAVEAIAAVQAALRLDPQFAPARAALQRLERR